MPVAALAVAEASESDAKGLPVNVPLMLDSYWSNDFVDWPQRTEADRPAEVKLRTFSFYNMVLDAATAGRGFMMGHISLVSNRGWPTGAVVRQTSWRMIDLLCSIKPARRASSSPGRLRSELPPSGAWL